MIKGIGLQKVDVTPAEFKYYQELVNAYTNESQRGVDYFMDLFETDDNGHITIIKPIRDLPWAILFFVQNLMINQHLRSYDAKIEAIEERLRSIDK